MALETVSCPHCGYKFRMDLEARVNNGETAAVRSPFNWWKPGENRIRRIDIDCPNCKKRFEQEVCS